MTGRRALFEAAGGDRFVATEYARGPWDPLHCHGGPVAALLTRAVERTDGDDVDWQVSRLTVELTRPVPVGTTLHVETGVERPGRRVSLVAALLLADGVEVARLRSLRMRSEELLLPIEAPSERLEPGPEDATHEVLSAGGNTESIVSFARDGCEHRFAAGTSTAPGRADVWMRLRVPVVDGEEPTGAQRAAACADFGNGVSRLLDFEQYLFINPDLTVHLLRPPVGEWIGLRAVSMYGAQGAGIADSAIFDEHGVVGRGVQSLYLDRR